MGVFRYYIECENGFDPSAIIKSILKRNNYSLNLEPNHNNHWVYETSRRLTKKVFSKIESLIGIRSLADLENIL